MIGGRAHDVGGEGWHLAPVVACQAPRLALFEAAKLGGERGHVGRPPARRERGEH